jgi:hypothetical protein
LVGTTAHLAAADADIHDISDRIKLISTEDGATTVAINSERGIIVLDTLWCEEVAASHRAAIAKAFGKDTFSYVLTTVERLDFSGGNSLYSDATIVAHEHTRSYLSAQGADLDKALEPLVKMWRRKQEASGNRLKDKDETSTDYQNEKSWYETCKARADQLQSGFELVLPQITFNDRISLDCGDITVNLIYFGKASSSEGMYVIEIPEEKTLIFSGFILHDQHLAPTPMADSGAELDVERWLMLMDELFDVNDPPKLLLADYFREWTVERAIGRREYIRRLWEGMKKYKADGKTFEEASGDLTLEKTFPDLEKWPIYKHGEDWYLPQHTYNQHLFWENLPDYQASQ